jgi:hypothetical protein
MSRIRKPPPDLVDVTECRRGDYIACGVYDPRDDPRLQQDMEAELAADVEWFDHPTKGRIRLRDELVHPPGPIRFPLEQPDGYANEGGDGPATIIGHHSDLHEALDALPSEWDDLPQPFYDRRADRP